MTALVRPGANLMRAHCARASGAAAASSRKRAKVIFFMILVLSFIRVSGGRAPASVRGVTAALFDVLRRDRAVLPDGEPHRERHLDVVAASRVEEPQVALDGDGEGEGGRVEGELVPVVNPELVAVAGR